jgi:hypothetical protein
MKKKLSASISLLTLMSVALFAAGSAQADMGVGLRGGTMGLGVDFNIGLGEKVTARVAYSYFSYDQEVEDTEVTYDGTIEISSISGFLDWHPFGGSFRLSLGAVGSGPKIDVDGTPAPGQTVEINGRDYNSAELGSLRGEIKIGNSVAPYVGIGWGNTVDKDHRVTFLFDLGAIYGGEPDVKLTAVCGPAAGAIPGGCARLQNDVNVESQELRDEVTAVEWYPVLNIGIGIRF